MTERNTPTAGGRAEAWTWADLLSSYTFWALAAASTCAYLAMRFWSFVGLGPPMRMELGVSDVAVGWMQSVRIPAAALALCLGWAASRSKPVGALMAAGAIQLMGALMVWSTPSTAWLVLGSFLIHLGQLSFLIGVPVALVGARVGPKDFFVAYGTIWLLHLYCDVGAASLSSLMGWKLATAVLPVLAIATLVLLAPVPRALFSENPPGRGRVLEPVRRGAVSAAFLTLVPFYVFYWLYRVHGEAARTAPSRSLLAPRAALGLSLSLTVLPAIPGAIARFSPSPIPELQLLGVIGFPFVLPVLLAALMDSLNEAAAARGAGRLGSPTASFFWTLVLPPVGVGLVQAALNRLTESAPARPRSAAGTRVAA